MAKNANDGSVWLPIKGDTKPLEKSLDNVGKTLDQLEIKTRKLSDGFGLQLRVSKSLAGWDKQRIAYVKEYLSWRRKISDIDKQGNRKEGVKNPFEDIYEATRKKYADREAKKQALSQKYAEQERARREEAQKTIDALKKQRDAVREQIDAFSQARKEATALSESLEKASYKEAFKVGRKAGRRGEEVNGRDIKAYAEQYKKDLLDVGATSEQASSGAYGLAMGLAEGYKRGLAFNRVLGGLKKGLSGFAKGLKGLGRGAFNVVKKGFSLLSRGSKQASNSLNLGLKNILAYALGIKTLFALFSKMKGFATEGFGNLTRAGGETQRNVEKLSASMQYLKNALGSAIAPIYNTVAPALSNFIDMLAKAVNAFAKFVAVLTGKQLVVAKKSFEGIGSSASGAGSAMGDASKNAKELKRQLMGFDQIEKLDDIADTLGGGSGGGGGGAGGIDYGDMFTVEEADDATSKWAELVKESWRKADFTELGTIVGNKLASALDSIPWATIQAKAGKVAKSFATFLNGVADSEFFPSLGTAIAEALNTAVETGYQFVINFDFKKFGTSIGRGINSAIENFNWKQAGFTTGEWVKGIFDLLSGAIQEVDWQELGRDVASFLASIDWAGVISSAFELVGSVAGAFAGFVAGLFEDFSESVKEWFNENAFTEDGEFTITGLLNGIWNGIKNIGTWIYDNIWVPFRDGFKKAFGIASPSKEMEKFGGYIIDGLKNGLTNIWEKVKGGFDTLVKSIGNFLKDPVGTIKVALDKGVEKAKQVWDGFKNSTAVKTLQEKGANIIASAKNTWDGIKNGTALKTLKETGANAIAKAKTIFDSVKNSTAVKTISNAFSNWSKWKDNKKEYGAVASAKATKSLGTKWADGKKWNRDIAEYNAVKDKTVTVTLRSSDKIVGNGHYSLVKNAKGGAFYGGSWHGIPQYAEGGRVTHGSLFIAGEAGAEAVGTVNGRTEVLNKSQLGAVISNGVATMLSKVRVPDPTPQLAFVERQVAQQQIQQGQTLNAVVSLLTQILTAVIDKDTDVYFDTNKVTNEIVKQINRNTRATGLCEIVI